MSATRSTSYRTAVESDQPIKPSRPPPPVRLPDELHFDMDHFDSPTTQILDYYLNQRKKEYTSPQQVTLLFTQMNLTFAQ